MGARLAAIAGRALIVMAAWGMAWAVVAAEADLPAEKTKAEPARPSVSGANASAATLGPLAIGSTVKDRTGATIGHIVLLTTDKAGASVARIRQGEAVYTVPVVDLHARAGGVVSTVTLDDLRRQGGAASP